MSVKDNLAIVLAIFGIVLSAGKKDYQTLILLIVLTICVIIIMALIDNNNKIENNKNEIGEIKRNINIDKRLTKLELKVFKK